MGWSNENPELMEEIATLPLKEQNAAMREAIGYDPDRIREEAEERAMERRQSPTKGQLCIESS